MEKRRKIFFYGDHYHDFYKKLDISIKKLLKQKDLNKNTMRTNKKLTSFEDHLDQQYGKKGSSSREKYEQGFEAFKIGVLIQEARKKKNLTQEELAKKVGTTKNYISRIENDASDIRLSTLLRIINDGLGGHLSLSFDG